MAAQEDLARRLLARETIPPVSQDDEQSVRLPPGRPFGSVAYFQIRDGQLVATLPDETELTPDDDAFHERFDPQGICAGLLARFEAAGIGHADHERAPEQRREFRRQLAIGRRHNARVRRARLLRRLNIILRPGKSRPRSRERRAQAGARGRCRGPDDADGGEPDLDGLPELYSFGEHRRRYADRTPTERLALFLALPAWQRAQASEVLSRAADVKHEAAS